jgi:4-amino-4-deoxy-L-arabinose transferase-like glycosyltransferase
VKARVLAGLTLLLAATLLCAGLASHGIWDPWELEAADAARRLAEGKSADAPGVTTWLVSLGFRPFGVHEWSGRLPIAVAGFATVLLAWAFVGRWAGARAGMYAALITTTSPLFLFNARTMLGEAPSFALQAAVAMFGAAAVLTASTDPAPSPVRRVALLAGWVAAIAAATAGRGALLAALPPVAAVAAVAVIEGRLRPRAGRGIDAAMAWVACVLALALAALIASDVLADRAAHSVWTGGRPTPGSPPRFDTVIEHVFHAFAPWSALLPLALARMVFAPPAGDAAGVDTRERSLRLILLLWIAAGYGAQTLYLARYGQDAAYLPVVALAACVALLIRDVERSLEAAWPMAIASALCAGLVLRDYALYPGAPVEGMAIHAFEIPKVVNPRLWWAACLGAFALATCLAFGARRDPGSLVAPARWLGERWRRGWGFRVWLIAFLLAALALFAWGIVAWVAPKSVRMSSQAIRWGKALMWAPFALPLVVAGAQLLLRAQARLGERFAEARFAGVFGTGALVGAYAVFGFMSQISAHFSPREIYETYNRLAKRGELLAEYKVGGRAAAYYARGEVRDVAQVAQLVDHLAVEPRRWAAFPADSLAEIDRAFRRRMQQHLFVADARSARVVLATNQPIAGRKNDSFLVQSVRRDVPAIQHPVRARFDDRIEFLGYDLDLPHDGYVGAGESFGITWYFRCLATVAGDYKVFVHVDGNEQRIHGDHEPIDGKYPPRLWDVGDVIVDRQTLKVPGNYRSGPYTIYLGFYAGSNRLPVREGPKDDADRVRAGVLRIQ